MRSVMCSVWIALLILCSFSINCGLEYHAPRQPDFAKTYQFPYEAGVERAAQISNGKTRIEIGFKTERVIEIIGQPDFQNDHFDPGRWFWNMFEKHEFSWAYVLYAEFPYGIGKPDRFLEISFDKDGIVKSVEEKLEGEMAPRIIMPYARALQIKCHLIS